MRENLFPSSQRIPSLSLSLSLWATNLLKLTGLLQFNLLLWVTIDSDVMCHTWDDVQVLDSQISVENEGNEEFVSSQRGKFFSSRLTFSVLLLPCYYYRNKSLPAEKLIRANRTVKGVWGLVFSPHFVFVRNQPKWYTKRKAKCFALRFHHF